MQDKQNNKEGMKKVIIISNENIYKLGPFTKKCENRHRDTMIEFIYETGVPVSVSDGRNMILSSQEIAYNLVEQGFCVLLYNPLNNPANLTIYLPNVLGYEQRQYINLATSIVSQCELSVFSINHEEEVFHYLEDASKNIDSLLEFINTIPSAQLQKKESISQSAPSSRLIKVPPKIQSEN